MQPISQSITANAQPSSNNRVSKEALILHAPDRLRALSEVGLLDTAPEKAFDRLTAMACRLLNAPIALISLVDSDRQFLKSQQGLAEPWASRQSTPLSHSFCQYVVTGNAPLAIEDAREHPLLCDNLAIRDLNVVGYLGIPLHTPEGYGIGSLCVIDNKPRVWSENDLQTLMDLAEVVMSEIALRQHLRTEQEIQHQLQENNILLQGVIHSTDDGMYARDLEGRYLLVNERGAALVGFTPQQMIGKKYAEIFPAETVVQIAEEDRETLASGETIQREQSWFISGVQKTFHSTRSAYRDAHGNFRGILSVLHDISELKETQEALRMSEANFRSLFESMTQGVIYQDAEGKIINANAAAQAILGLTLDELQGRRSMDPHWRAMHADGSDFPGEAHPTMVALRTGEVQRDVVMYVFNPHLDELRCIRVDAVPQFRAGEKKPCQVYALIQDVTEERRTTEKLAYHAQLLDNMHDAVIATDAHFKINAWNRGAEQMYGWQEHEVLGRSVREVIGSQISNEVRQKAIQDLQAAGRYRMELVTHHRQGAPIPTESITVGLQDTKGQIVGYLSINRDISQRKQAEEALHEAMALAQQQLAEIETLYATTPIGLAVLDRDLRYVRINDYLAANNGYSVAEHIGRTGAELIPNVANQLDERLLQVIQTGESLVNLEVTGRTLAQPDVERTWLESFYPWRYQDGQVLGLNVVVQEITERKQIEKALSHNEEQLRAITDNVPGLIAYIDRDERYRFVNATYERWYGKPREQILGQKVRDFVRPSTYAQAQPYITAVLMGQAVTFEVETTRNDKPVIWLMKYTPHIAASGEVLGFYTLTTDITEQKQIEANLQESEQRFRVTFEQAPIGIAHTNLQDKYIRVNNRLCDMLGYSHSELLQIDIHSITHPDDVSASHIQRQQLLADGGSSYTLEKRYLHKDGNYIWVNVTVSIVRNLKTHAPEYFIRIIEDISKRRQYEEALNELNATLEQRIAIRSRQLETSNIKLLESQTKLRQLSQQLMQMTEQERKRISREIHDQLGQSLTALKMEVKGAQRRLGIDPAAVTNRLQAADKLIDETVDMVRRIASDLRPGVLDHFGLGPAVEWQMAQFKERNHIDYQLDLNIDAAKITSDMATAAFRILQEALTNIVRHAQANSVHVSLTTDEETFVMKVSDNGRGLGDIASTRLSLGILGMNERAQQLDGWVELAGEEATGATLTLTLPIRANGEKERE